MSEELQPDRCEICGSAALEGQDLLNWRYYNYQDKMVCAKCTEDDMDATYRRLGFTEAEVKALRKNRSK